MKDSFDEISVLEIINNISWDNLNIDVEIAFADSCPIVVQFRGYDTIEGYSKNNKMLNIDISKKISIDSLNSEVINIIETVKRDINSFKEDERNELISEKIKELEMEFYGWE